MGTLDRITSCKAADLPDPGGSSALAPAGVCRRVLLSTGRPAPRTQGNAESEQQVLPAPVSRVSGLVGLGQRDGSDGGHLWREQNGRRPSTPVSR